VTFAWSKEAVERLKALHAQGLSGSDLAARLGSGLTRSAIFGKLHRLGLTGAKGGPKRQPSGLAVASRLAHDLSARPDRGSAPHGTGPMKFNFARKDLSDRRIGEARRLSSSRKDDCPGPAPSLRTGIIDIRDGQCRFIDGDDGLACGHRVVPGSSWCAAHHAIVFIEEAA
jgi:GcrA cell cycle regulator